MRIGIGIGIALGFCFACFSGVTYAHDWRDADRSSIGVAPDPQKTSEAVVQVYVARTYNFYGMVAVHSWISVKEKDALVFTNYQVMGFRLKKTGSALVIENDIPDRRWFGNTPEIICDLRAEVAEAAIPKIKDAVALYAYKNFYRIWPGPNSNTFISHIIRHVPEIGVELPPNAIGKDWIEQGQLVGQSETNTGYQFSLFGLLGLTLGLGDGIEINILGLSFGLDIYRPALKLPFIGRLGFKDASVFSPPL